MLKPHSHRPDLMAIVEDALNQPSLYDESLKLLARLGLTIPSTHLTRDWENPYSASEIVEAAWLVAYRDPKTHWAQRALATYGKCWTLCCFLKFGH
jgi:tryptophan 2,3-dioxygenase